jgi:hypothetical protein
LIDSSLKLDNSPKPDNTFFSLPLDTQELPSHHTIPINPPISKTLLYNMKVNPLASMLMT